MNRHIFLQILLLFTVAISNNALGTPALQEDGDNLSIEEIQKMYATIRNISLDPTQTIQVDSFILHKDAAEFIFGSGYLYFFEPVGDKVVAAFFQGKGILRLSTENEIELQQIQRFTDEDTIEQEFEQALLLFTDSTYERITVRQKIVTQSIDDIVIEEVIEFRKEIREQFIWNVAARILRDLVDAQYGHFFQAYLDCPANKQLLFIVDPLDEEEVSLIRYEQVRFFRRADFETWYSGHAQEFLFWHKPQFDIKIMDVDVSIDSKEMLKATAQLQFISLVDNERIVPMILAPMLRVETVISGTRDTCFFIQENKEEDAQLWIVFPTPLKRDSIYTLTLTYSGDEILADVGGDNFVVGARALWFPSFYTNPRDPRRFIIKFAIPEELTLLGTGNLLRRWDEENAACSEWDSEIDCTVAGFNYGKFSTAYQRSSLCEIECYTNVKLSDDLLRIRRILEENKTLQAELMLLPQELTTDGIGKNAAIESRNAYEVYVHFFGKIPFHNITVSQQPQKSFGQSWPTLIFLPFTAFFSESLKDRLGLLWGERSVMWYETLASHEIAHQWWGHTITTSSYHDEWLEEGFAEYSAALYLQTTEGIPRFKDYMKMLRQQVLTKVEKGKRATELGPIWLGDRLSSLETPIGRRLLIYAKGAYVLHMLRMMLFDYDNKSDELFISMMKDYVRTYSRKITSTEDFKRIVEKHFGDNMDWFFNQWVYGIEIPVYKFDYRIESTNDGKYLLTITAQQKGVSPSFKMPMHFVINFGEGHAVVHMLITGSEPIAKQFRLPSEPKSIEPNPWHAVLCEIAK